MRSLGIEALLQFDAAMLEVTACGLGRKHIARSDGLIELAPPTSPNVRLCRRSQARRRQRRAAELTARSRPSGLRGASVIHQLKPFRHASTGAGQTPTSTRRILSLRDQGRALRARRATGPAAARPSAVARPGRRAAAQGPTGTREEDHDGKRGQLWRSTHVRSSPPRRDLSTAAASAQGRLRCRSAMQCRVVRGLAGLSRIYGGVARV
jgi:hypothetical protein